MWKTALLSIATVATIGWTESITSYSPPPGPIHITYWEKWTEFEADAMRKVVNTFNSSQNRIFVDYLPISGVENKTLMAIAGGEPPDIAGLFGPNVAQYADDEAVEPLDQLCAENGITRDRYIKPYIDICTYNDHLYALPSAPASAALHYNRSLLAQAGIDPDKPPTTMEELTSYSDKLFLKKNGHVVRTGFMPAEPGWWNWAWGFFFGGKLWDGKSKITANSPENVKAFEWVQEFGKRYGVQDLQTFRTGFGDFNSPQNAFLDQRVAMELQGVWMSNFIGQFAPKLNWAAAPFPHPADRPDLANMTVADLDVLVIPRGARHRKEAFEFIKFVESQKGMEMLCLGQKKNSPLKEVSPDFYRLHPNHYIKLFSELPQGKNVITAPKIGIWPEYVAALSNAFDEINLVQKTPQQALDEVQETMQKKLDESLERLRKRKAFDEQTSNR